MRGPWWFALLVLLSCLTSIPAAAAAAEEAVEAHDGVVPLNETLDAVSDLRETASDASPVVADSLDDVDAVADLARQTGEWLVDRWVPVEAREAGVGPVDDDGDADAAAAEEEPEPRSSADDGDHADDGGAGDGSVSDLIPPLLVPLPRDPLPSLPVPSLPSPTFGYADTPDDALAPAGSDERSFSALRSTTAAPAHGLPAAQAMAAAAAVAAVAVLAGSTTGSKLLASCVRPFVVLRHAFSVGLGAALFSRIAKDSVLDHDRRQEIIDFLKVHPGACVTEIHESIGASANTVTHHLGVLVANGLASSVKQGRRRCFFPANDGLSPQARVARATLGSDAAERVFKAIQVRPGIRQQELARALGITPTSVVFHARRLEDAGIVRRQRAGREMVYYPALTPA